MAASMLSFVWRKATAGGVSNWIYRKQNRLFSCFRGCPPSSLGACSIRSPWLMLPPASASEGAGDLVYNLYSLADNKVLSLNERAEGQGADDVPDDKAVVVGSSHGLLALFNRRNGDVFLSNPLSRRHVKLPSLHTLPNIEEYYWTVFGGCPEKLIISSSPTEDEEGCRALMNIGPQRELAFCCPGRSTEWTLIGDLPPEMHYKSCVYSSRQQLFFCSIEGDDALHAWGSS